MKKDNLAGKIALVTGGTSGIGRAVAIRLAQQGASVIIVGRNCEFGNRLVKEITSEYGNCSLFIRCDVCSSTDIVNLYKRINEDYGRLDFLFNNAGILLTAALDEIDHENWEKIYTTNVEAVINITRTFMPMLQKSHGNIVNNASVAGMHSHTEGRRAYLYASSKAALIQFSKLCALNYAKEVRVNCICPGIIDTPIYINRDYSRFSGIPMGRVGTAEEVANVVVFLASDEASYLTGLVMPVDGGSALV